MTILYKNAASVLSYGHDWSTWLGSETIASSSWAADAGITIDSDSNSTTATSVFLSGGTAGTSYTLSNTITDTAGNTEVEHFEVYVRQGLTVETGTGASDSNSYVSEEEFAEYLGSRGLTNTADLSVLLLKAMDYLETLDYLGSKYSETQALQWPRYSVYIDGYSIPSTTIPNELKLAQMRLAYEIDQGNDPLSTIERKVKREKVGPVEVEYSESSASSDILRSVNKMIRKLLSGTNGAAFTVSR